MRGQGGAVLGVVVLGALVSSIAAYAVLMTSVSDQRKAQATRQRVRSRHASEAGLVQALQRLQNGTFSGPSETYTVDGMAVTVVQDCGVTPCELRSTVSW